MGKAAKLKQLRRIALQLPVIQTKQVVRETVSEKDVTEKTDKNGEEINPQRNYVRSKLVEANLNHYKKMKQNYKKAGMAGATLYARSVIQYAKQNPNSHIPNS